MTVICILPLLLGGCSSVIDISSTEALYRQGKFHAAYQSLMTKREAIIKAQGPLVMDMDAGLLSRLSGKYELSNEQLTSAEQYIQQAYTQSISLNIASYFLNDNTRPYRGEAYEDIYLNIFKALNYLHLGDEEAAFVELQRSLEKQSLLKLTYEKEAERINSYVYEQGVSSLARSTSYPSTFSSSALAHYLSMIVAQSLGESQLSSYAQQQLQASFKNQAPLYPFPIPLSLTKELSSPAEGKARVHVVAFHGLAPVKKQAVEVLYVSPNNYAKIAYPVLSERKSPIRRVVLNLDDGRSYQLEMIENMSIIASETFKASSSLAYARAATRSTLKALGVAIYDSVIHVDTPPSAGEEFLSWLLKLTNYATESADVRSSHFLPSAAWVGSVDLEPGTYSCTVAFQDNMGRTLYTQRYPSIAIEATQLNIIEAVCPL